MGISRAEYTHFPKKRHLKIRDKLVDLSTPMVMGIINITPDSFFASSRKSELKTILQSVEMMQNNGVDLIDLGAYSSRPGAEIISSSEELKRIEEPVKEINKHFPDLILSLDTFRAEVAKAGLNSGIDIINDISACRIDHTLIDVLKEFKPCYILMHGVESIHNMHQIKEDSHLFNEITSFFSAKIRELNDLGLFDVIIDPGFGFGKTIEQNYMLLEQLEMFQMIDHPILAGISRKSMISKKLGITAEESLNGTTILNTLAVLKGASILRVHDVEEAKQIIDLMF